MKWSPQGFPAQQAIRRTYDEADLNRAIQAYRFFYPTVSGAAIFKGNANIGVLPNRVFGTLDSQPKHVGFTLNSDTPYAPILLDLRDSPMAVELPPGPLIVVAMDINQRWVADMGIPGPDAGNGGKHLLLAPDYQGEVPPGYYTARSTSYRMLVGARSLPIGGDLDGAFQRLKTINVHPLNPGTSWQLPTWLDLTPNPQDTTPLAWENNIRYWKMLHDVIDSEPPYEAYRNNYGELASLGIAKGKAFRPDGRMKEILERAAQIGNEQMRVEAFADRRPDRIVWPDRKWEWAALRFENGNFDANGYLDLDARDKWFFQAIGASPAMFRRDAGAGSLYWLGLRDRGGAYLDGRNSYKLRIPLPVPARLFWSVTVYDTQTRSQIQTDQAKAALRSLFELKDFPKSGAAELYFGPEVPQGKQGQWIKTIPGQGWFTYFRIYGPEKPAFDGNWKPEDFERLN